MIPTKQRIQLLAEACQTPYITNLLGQTADDEFSSWLTAELGHPDALDRFIPHGPLLSKAVAPACILHIVSGNTPHAAIQSIIRGVLLGSHNIVKLPSSGLPEITDWIILLPDDLRETIEVHSKLTDNLWARADAVIAIGSDDTIAEIQKKILPHQTLIPHGHKVSIGIVYGDHKNASVLAARDVSLFNQRGCLSPHAIYVDGDARGFANMLASEMEEFATDNPPDPLTLSDAGAIRNLRETCRFASANSDTTHLWESSNNLDWTVIYEASPQLKLSCLNRCIYVKPLPENLCSETLGKQAQYLSTIAIHPFDTTRAEAVADLPAHRICPLGESQSPSLFWHHDGFAPLASLVRWKDIG